MGLICIGAEGHKVKIEFLTHFWNYSTCGHSVFMNTVLLQYGFSKVISVASVSFSSQPFDVNYLSSLCNYFSCSVPVVARERPL